MSVKTKTQETERPKCGYVYVHASGYREVCTRDPNKECPVIGHGDWRRAPKEVTA